MTSGAWGSGKPSGDGQPDRGTAGAAAPIPAGSAMVLIRWFAMGMVAFCFGWTINRLSIDGVTLIGTVAAVVWVWTEGVFTRSFWFPDDTENEHLAATDAAIDNDYNH